MKSLVGGLHALAGHRAGVLDLAVGEGVDHTPRAELLLELGILRVVVGLRLFLGVEVVEVAEELVEAMIGRQVLVAVAEVVLAELTGRVALSFSRSAIVGAQSGMPWSEPGMPIVSRPVRNGCWPEDERRAARRAALLGVGVGEHRAFLGDAVDVRRLVAHDAVVVGADVVHAEAPRPGGRRPGRKSPGCSSRRA